MSPGGNRGPDRGLYYHAHSVRGRLERQVGDQVADLLNLEVDLLFFATTSTCFELDEADEDVLFQSTAAEPDGAPGHEKQGADGDAE